MQRTIAFFALFFGVLLVGCNDQKTSTGSGSTSTSTTKPSAAKSKDHSGWWCVEHGIPEDECLMCSIGEEACKKKNDWCEIHDYCKSQCFGCDPKLKERYAAQYKAKYGKDAPEPDDNPPGKNPVKK